MRIFLAMVAACLLAPSTFANVVISMFSPSYTQDFDTLASTGTSSTLPTGWFLLEAGANANTTYTAGTGSGNVGDTYSFGASGSGERALGTLRSGTNNPTIGARIVVGPGSHDLLSLAIDYTGEEWRLGAAGRADRLDFQYSLDATSLDTGIWVDVNSLDFSTPVTTGSATNKNGNDSMFRAARSGNITSLAIPAGGSIWIRWLDAQVSGSQDGLAIDDLTISGAFAAIPEPSALLCLAAVSCVVGAASLARRRTRQ